MGTRRRGLRGALAAAAVVACSAAPAAAADRPAVYGLVIGVDDYGALPKLQGAVNDAQMIANSLKTAGAREVVTLLNGAATRAQVVASLKSLSAKAAQTGGWLILTYAGHGGQEPARMAGDEVDGKDEVLLLPGFATRGAATGERLVDNEIFGLLSEIPSNVTVVFVADACHSGTMSRTMDARSSLHTTRLARYGPIVDDALPPPPPVTKAKEAEDLPNVIFVASALDSEVTPEVAIEGTPHGAVSWHFARAMEGAADTDHNGVTTLSELRQYITVNARLASESRQTPGVQFLAGRSTDAFAPAIRSVSTGATASERPTMLGVWSVGGAMPSGVPGVVPAKSRESADLVWDRAARQVVSNATGDLVAEQGPSQPDVAFVAGVADKWRALPILKRLAGEQPLSIAIGPKGAGARYVGGIVTIRADGSVTTKLPYLTILNLAGDGTVQNLFPVPGKISETGRQPPGYAPEFPVEVRPPFGADHIVAIATAEEPTALRATLTTLEGRQAGLEAATAIQGYLARRPHAIGVVGVYTGAKD